MSTFDETKVAALLAYMGQLINLHNSGVKVVDEVRGVMGEIKKELGIGEQR
jgi:hypothetical protein